jgi:hypothetical protein
MKKSVLMFLAASLLMLGAVADAQAVVCARGVYRAGCAGPHGAVVARRPPARRVYVAPRPVHRHGCAWVNGRKVCR